MVVKSILLVLFIAVLVTACSQQSEEDILAKAKAIHEKALTIDTHVDIPGGRYATAELDPGIDHPRLRCDLVKMKKGGLDGVFLAVYVGQRERNAEGYQWAYENAITKFEAIHRLAEQMHPDKCEIAYSTDQVEPIAATGKRVILIGIENGYVIGTDLANIQKYYDLGARYITLSHSGHNQICDSCRPRENLGDGETLHNGFSEFGKQVVAEMNRLGIMADVSHISEKSYWDLIEISKAPIIASHSAARALTDNPRNLDDDQLRALKKNGGVIQVVALTSYLDSQEHIDLVRNLQEEMGIPDRRAMRRLSAEERTALEPKLNEYKARLAEMEKTTPGVNVAKYVDHIDHIVKVAGIDHVGIGTDFDGGGGIPGFNNHSECLNVTIELVKRGYTEEDIIKIWGGNLMRVWKECERVAKEIQQAN